MPADDKKRDDKTAEYLLRVLEKRGIVITEADLVRFAGKPHQLSGLTDEELVRRVEGGLNRAYRSR